MFTKLFYNILRISSIFFLSCLFLITFPRSWSLYPLGFFLFIGFILWIIYFRDLTALLRSINILKFITPVILYFVVNILNIIIYSQSISYLNAEFLFLLIPIFGLPLFVNLKINEFKTLLNVYVFGILISITVLIIRVFYIVINQSYVEQISFFKYIIINRYWFFTSHFSVFEHPSYLSMKIMWALIIVSFFSKYFKRLIRGLALILFSIAIFLLASKAAIIAWIILILIMFSGFLSRKIKNSIVEFLLVIITTLVLLIGTYFLTNKIARINDFVLEIKKAFTNTDINWKNLDQRTREWYCAIQLIKEKPIFGHGIEKVEDRMVEEYLKNRWEEEARVRYNAHNQFLETQMTYGIPGTLSLLWMLFTPLIFRKRLMYPKLATAFVLMMTFFLMFESMFVRQWGIMFFTLFYCILLIPSKELEAVPVNYTALKNQ